MHSRLKCRRRPSQVMFTQWGTCEYWAETFRAAALALGPCDAASDGEMCGYTLAKNGTYHSGHEMWFTLPAA